MRKFAATWRLTKWSLASFSTFDRPVAARSDQGDSGALAAGSGNPRSRSNSRVDTARAPPAESPVSPMFSCRYP